MSERKPSDTADRVVVRLPDGMRKRLNDLARESGRTANAEAVKAFEAWLDHDPDTEPAFVRLPERLRERVIAAAHLSGRSVLDEIVARVAESFAPVAERNLEGDQLKIRAELRDAMHEVIEGMIRNPEMLKLFEASAKRGRGEPSGG